MSTLYGHHSYVLLLCLIVIINCETYDDRPKIKTENGDLILEPAFDKSIYLKRNGPKSGIYFDNIDISMLQNITKNSASFLTTENMKTQNLNKQFDLQNKIEGLENSIKDLNKLHSNISYLFRRFTKLKTRLRALELLVNSKDINECQSQPCENGGTCLNLVNGYFCLCPTNWKGTDCNEDVNECRNYAGTDLGCQNGATCINKPGSYECLCKPGWYGLDCTRKVKDCSGGDYEMCGHGTCIPVTTGTGIKCFCNQGWTSNSTDVACLNDVNECDPGQPARCSMNPRVNCINLPGSFRCGPCPVGYEGDGYVCHDIDECLTLNGGCSKNPMVACHNTIGSRICGACPPGFQGDGVTCVWRGSCAINHGGCHPSARCIEHSISSAQMALCVCPYGMDGDGVGLQGCYIANIDNKTLNCENNPCGEHGHCHALNRGYTCICLQGYGGARCESVSNFCSSSPCLNGGTCRPDDKLSKGYRCECSALYTGELCQIHSQPCGGVLDSEEGSIVYPLSNTTYNHNARCAWVIHTSPDKVINVTFSKFDVEADSECYFDFVQIHDGRSSASQLIGRFCGNTFPNGGNIISSHNNLYFWFRSDHSVARGGFALHWISIPPVCGGDIDASKHGRISSPGSPGKYPPNRDCFWHLQTTLGKRIELHFFQLDVEANANCSFDYVAIYDGEHRSDPLINKYCNSTQPVPLQSSSSEMLIHFHSDATSSGKGFQIVYAPIEGIPGCGGFFTTDRGEIVSPSYNGAYLDNLLCEYRIKTRQDTKIRLTFKVFSLERSSLCRYDFLKVFDGSSSDSRLVGKYCGNVYPRAYTSSTNDLFLIFKTDHTTSLEGFKIMYEAVCSKEIIGDSGIIKSPGYPFNYPKQIECEYIINTTPGKAIILTFQDFDLEDNRYYHCQYDHVEIRDGHSVNSTLLGRYCGGTESTPSIQTSTYNYMYVKFHSDMSVSGRGFYANFTTVDTDCGGIHKEHSGVINHPADNNLFYSHNQSCTWMLVAPVGMHIKLTWNRFDLENLNHCYADYVQLIELDESNENNTLGKYCGDSLPPALTTSSNRLQINFVSDTSFSGSGFSVSYSFIDEKTHCGGLYVKSHGFIYSPGWPQSYEPNRDCTWQITVPVGQQVLLNITDFDLERPIRDSCDLGDYLTVRDGSSEKSPLISKFCGYYKYKRIASTANTIYIHFHSDFYLTGKGFQIEWDGTITGCGGTLTSVRGSISSPNYPQNYNENSECFYRIVSASGSRIAISFTDLDLERTKDCKDDYVELFDGRDSNSHSFGRYCYKTAQLNDFKTTSNYAFIKFRSDIFITAKGFLLTYDTICNNNITGHYGVIESPGYPDKYPMNSNCLWTITVPKGNKINVTFTNFELYNSISRPIFGTLRSFHLRRRMEPCYLDYVQIKDTAEENFGKKTCGSNKPQLITSTKNSLQIKFVSSSPFPRKGFRLEWVSYGCGGYIQKPSGSLSFDRALGSTGEIECDWIIETPLGTAVSITFSDFYMMESHNCTEDAIEVYNGQSSAFPLLSKFCNRHKTVIQASSNYMFIRLVKHSTLRDVNFQSKFSSFTEGCGGGILSSSGLIHSKNYPKNYDDNLDCLWIISVPKYHRIKLEFLDFDLYSDNNENMMEKSNDKCGDMIKIYDSENIFNTNYSHLLCPDWNRTAILSEQSSIIVQFTTDSFGSAKGFKANFTMTCGATIVASSDGVITNNNYISHNNQNCTWTILAVKSNEKVKLTIGHISLPKNSDIVTIRNCPSSFLRVFDGNDDKAPLIDEFCGTKVPSTIVSHGNALTVQLGTYSDTIVGSFLAHYSSLSSSCGGKLTSEEGYVASPNYPLSYPNNADCEWTISTSPGNRVYVTFEMFDLVYSEGCNEDYLEVRENNNVGNLLAVYCGSEIPTNTTTGTRIYIKFRSNSSKKPGQGFLLHYGFLHGNEITGMNRGEIASPLYPQPYDGIGEFSWRIITDTSATISLRTDHLEIIKRNETCGSQLRIYDGYDEEAPLLNVLCGMFKNENNNVQTSSNVAYIKLILDSSSHGALFHIQWAQSDKSLYASSLSKNINCGLNYTQIVLPQSNVIFSSPNYPEPYGPDLNCEWIFHATPGRHLILSFKTIELEETTNCWADYLSIFSSNKGLQWQPIEENICLSEFENKNMPSTSYIKVLFKSDGYTSRKGFQATVRSVCGGLLESASGFVQVTWFDYTSMQLSDPKLCNWTVKVRPGRTIKSTFVDFNITNTNECKTYILIRNGESVESPILGKYCGYEHENKNEILSSSNVIYITYKTVKTSMILKQVFQNFKLRYEEINIECGATSTLDLDHSWEIINSPNYPSIPLPYTECIWTFTGPPGEILRIDFLDRFDLEDSKQCESEFVEVRDGSSELSLPKGLFCRKPGTVKASSNNMFIKYSTQIPEPRNGFKANVSIDVCGGTIIAESGQIISPGYPHMAILPPSSVCQWHIMSKTRHVILLEFKDLDLPETEKTCDTKVSIEDPISHNRSAEVTLIKEFCDGNLETTKTVESFSNEVLVKLHIGKPSQWTHSSESRGFKLIFNSSRPSCGGSVTASEGFIMTPGYPRETSLAYCQWDITTPNENRRIRLELLDFDINHNLGILNGLWGINHQSLEEYNNFTQATPVFESTGNRISFYLWMGPVSKTKHRFKARYSSDEPALCGGNLNGIQGHVMSPNIDRSYVCQWVYNNLDQPSNSSLSYGSMYVIINITSSGNNMCGYSDSRLNFYSRISDSNSFDSLFIRNTCGNYSKLIYRIPSINVKIKATQHPRYPITFDLDWKLQQCGGLIRPSQTIDSILNIPVAHNETINCAWIIKSRPGIRINLKLEGTFNLDCSDEYLLISEEVTETSRVIGDYCNTKRQTNPLLSSLSLLYVQYHSKPQNSTNIKLVSHIVTNLCGGLLTKYDRVFSSPNYPKNYLENQECIWKIESEVGYRISLQFVGRFVIEDTANCTKDVIIVYDWIENEYKEMSRFCGRRLPPMFNSTSNRMKVVFRTDAAINLEGFKATWTPICGGKYVAKVQEQFLYSPGYSNKYYPSLNCLYELTAPSEQIMLKFLDFELEGSYPECEYDNVTIIHQSDSNYFNGVYCGKKIPPPLQFYSNINITFKTDFFGQRKGFKLLYSLYNCGGIVKEQTVLTSGTLDTYSDNSNCTWLIQAPTNKIVILKFPYIDLESSYECYSDYIAVYNGLNLDFDQRIALLCGHLNSSTVVKSKENSMILQFVSDSYLNYKGFKAEILFTYSEAVGCGGTINLDSSQQYQLKSPLFNNSPVYENFLECHWTIKAPLDKIVKVEFTSFHVASCPNVNQTELGYDKCDCDLIEFKDGLNPTSLIIGTYCGHNIPPQILSSTNVMSIRFSTDGEIQSSGFEITLTSQSSICGQSVFTVSHTIQRIRSPSYETGSIPRGIHCNYFLDTSFDSYAPVHIRVNNLDIEAENLDLGCNKDKLIITSNSHHPNVSFSKDLIINAANDHLFSNAYLFESTLNFPQHIILCGYKKSIDYYFTSNINIHLQTSADSSTLHRGVELEVSIPGVCGRNYTELQGRIYSYHSYNNDGFPNSDCSTLITVPENYTISVYFILISPTYMNENVYLEIFDGNETSSPVLYRVSTQYPDVTQVFSKGRNLILYSHMVDEEAVIFDLIYVATNKGQGCGGYIHNELGKVTSPLYPLEYRKKATCEWELETPSNTRLFLHFVVFDLGRACDHNYLRLVDRDGNTISTYCSETPADYTSENNYVKIVFTTNMNNGGTGWAADFVGVV